MLDGGTEELDIAKSPMKLKIQENPCKQVPSKCAVLSPTRADEICNVEEMSTGMIEKIIAEFEKSKLVEEVEQNNESEDSMSSRWFQSYNSSLETSMEGTMDDENIGKDETTDMKSNDESKTDSFENDMLDELDKARYQNNVLSFRLEQLEIENNNLRKNAKETHDKHSEHERENKELKKEMKLKKKFVFSTQWLALQE